MAGKGCFVAPKDLAAVRAEQLRRAEELLRRAVETARQSGIPPDELRAILDRLTGGK